MLQVKFVYIFLTVHTFFLNKNIHKYIVFLASNIGNIFRMIMLYIIKGNIRNKWNIICLFHRKVLKEYYYDMRNIFEPYNELLFMYYHIVADVIIARIKRIKLNCC